MGLADAEPLEDSFGDVVDVHGCECALLEHLIRPLQERRRDRQAERLGGLEVDD